MGDRKAPTPPPAGPKPDAPPAPPGWRYGDPLNAAAAEVDRQVEKYGRRYDSLKLAVRLLAAQQEYDGSASTRADDVVGVARTFFDYLSGSDGEPGGWGAENPEQEGTE